MATVRQILENEIEVPVIDSEGKVTTETRRFVNVPFPYFFPGDEFVIINWLARKEQPTTDQVRTPVMFEGKEYHGWYGWGSMTKKGFTPGLEKDYLQEWDLLEFVRDGVRLKRAALGDFLYGGAILDDLKVLVVPDGTVVEGDKPIEDGFGYATASVDAMVYNGHRAIKSNGSRDAFQFWQNFNPTEELLDAMWPMVRQDVVALADPAKFALDNNTAHHKSKQQWVDLDKTMALHPTVANSFCRGFWETIMRASGTVRTNSVWRVAVPSLVDTMATTVDVIRYRYPIDSKACIVHVEGQSDDLTVSEVKRIEKMRVAQFTLFGRQGMASGCVGIVEDREDREWDLCLSISDFKLWVGGVKTLEPGMHTLSDVAFGFNQYYAAGSAVGLGAKEWKKSGGDFDGDLCSFFAVKQDDRDFSKLVDQVNAWPASVSYKLLKSRDTDLDKRAKMVAESMFDVVSFACRVDETTRMVRDREGLARKLAYPNAAALDQKLHFWIKAGTDMFKTSKLFIEFVDPRGVTKKRPVTAEEIMKEIGVMQSNLITLFSRLSPCGAWKLSDRWFKRETPSVVLRDTDTNGWDKERLAGAVYYWMDGMVPTLCKLTLPNLAAAHGAYIETKPLSYFRSWAPKVNKELFAEVKGLQVWYNGQVARLNFSSPDAIAKLTCLWQTEIDQFIAEHGIDRETMANALWVVSHSARSRAAGATSVFMGMPEEAGRIITEKPGKADRKLEAVVMTGLLHNVETGPTGDWVGGVEVVYQPIKAKGKIVHRAVVCPTGDHPFQFQPKNEGNPWPTDMLGVIAPNEDQPAEGFYTAAFARRGDAKAWDLRLS